MYIKKKSSMTLSKLHIGLILKFFYPQKRITNKKKPYNNMLHGQIHSFAKLIHRLIDDFY